MAVEDGEKFDLSDAIVEIEMAIASLNGIAEAIQNNDLAGRQEQCGRTAGRLRKFMRQMRIERDTKGPS